ncbi:MAG: ABC transporter permease [SAR324 cluster bacterium]|nr:ABC transporter permease [SAR324 cluster bacterium]
MNAQFLLGKIIRSVITLWITVSLAFVLLRLAGDPAEALIPPDAGPEVVEYYRVKWGFDKPIHVQYFKYFGALVRGDFGFSLHTGKPVHDIVFQKVPNTLLLGGTAFLIALFVGIPLGVLAALKRNSLIDRVVMSFSVFAFAMPNFFFGLLLILSAAMIFHTFVGAGELTFWSLILPACTLGLANVGSLARFTRSTVLETLNKPFMAAALAKGVGMSRRIVHHALPNAAIPIVTLLGLSLGGLIAGSVVTETVFGWPGVGSLLIRAVQTRDLGVVQFIVLMVASTMTAVNLMVDLLYLVIDPRIRVK